MGVVLEINICASVLLCYCAYRCTFFRFDSFLFHKFYSRRLKDHDVRSEGLEQNCDYTNYVIT